MGQKLASFFSSYVKTFWQGAFKCICTALTTPTSKICYVKLQAIVAGRILLQEHSVLFVNLCGCKRFYLWSILADSERHIDYSSAVRSQCTNVYLNCWQSGELNRKERNSFCFYEQSWCEVHYPFAIILWQLLVVSSSVSVLYFFAMIISLISTGFFILEKRHNHSETARMLLSGLPG